MLDTPRMTFRDVIEALPAAFGDVSGTDDFSALNGPLTSKNNWASYQSAEGLDLIVHAPCEGAPDDVIFEARLASYSINGGAEAMAELLIDLRHSAFAFNLCLTSQGEICLERPVSLWGLTRSRVDREVSRFLTNCVMSMTALSDIRHGYSGKTHHLKLFKIAGECWFNRPNSERRFPKSVRIRDVRPHGISLPSPAHLPSSVDPAKQATDERQTAKAQSRWFSFLDVAHPASKSKETDTSFFTFVNHLPDLLGKENQPWFGNRPDPRQAELSGCASYTMRNGVEVCVEKNQSEDEDGEVHLYARIGKLNTDKQGYWFGHAASDACSMRGLTRSAILSWGNDKILTLKYSLDISLASHAELNAKMSTFAAMIGIIQTGFFEDFLDRESALKPALKIEPARAENRKKTRPQSFASIVAAHDLSVNLSPGNRYKPAVGHAGRREICLDRLSHFPLGFNVSISKSLHALLLLALLSWAGAFA